MPTRVKNSNEPKNSPLAIVIASPSFALRDADKMWCRSLLLYIGINSFTSTILQPKNYTAPVARCSPPVLDLLVQQLDSEPNSSAPAWSYHPCRRSPLGLLGTPRGNTDLGPARGRPGWLDCRAHCGPLDQSESSDVPCQGYFVEPCPAVRRTV